MKFTKRIVGGQVRVTLTLADGEIIHTLEDLLKAAVEQGEKIEEDPSADALKPLIGFVEAKAVADFLRDEYGEWAYVEKVDRIATTYTLFIKPGAAAPRSRYQSDPVPEGAVAIKWQVVHSIKKSWLD